MTDPADQFVALLKAMPDEALVQIYEALEAELDTRGVFDKEPEVDEAH
jgi:hypothetical protein